MVNEEERPDDIAVGPNSCSCGRCIPWKVCRISEDEKIIHYKANGTECDDRKTFNEVIEDIRSSRKHPLIEEYFNHFRDSPLDVRRRIMTYIVSYVYGGVVTRRRSFSLEVMSLTIGQNVILVTNDEQTVRDIGSPGNHPLFLDILDRSLEGCLDTDEREIATIYDIILKKFPSVLVATIDDKPSSQMSGVKIQGTKEENSPSSVVAFALLIFVMILMFIVMGDLYSIT